MIRLLFLIPFVLMSIAAFAFWIWMLIDCATKESSQGNDKVVWIIIIALANWIGAAIYFFVRRPKRIRELGA